MQKEIEKSKLLENQEITKSTNIKIFIILKKKEYLYNYFIKIYFQNISKQCLLFVVIMVIITNMQSTVIMEKLVIYRMYAKIQHV